MKRGVVIVIDPDRQVELLMSMSQSVQLLLLQLAAVLIVGCDTYERLMLVVGREGVTDVRYFACTLRLILTCTCSLALETRGLCLYSCAKCMSPVFD
jgi:hypothetical protein